MYTSSFITAAGLLLLAIPIIAAPAAEHVIEERHVVVEKRQADVSQLLQL